MYLLNMLQKADRTACPMCGGCRGLPTVSPGLCQAIGSEAPNPRSAPKSRSQNMREALHGSAIDGCLWHRHGLDDWSVHSSMTGKSFPDTLSGLLDRAPDTCKGTVRLLAFDLAKIFETQSRIFV